MNKLNPKVATLELSGTKNLERAIHQLSTQGASEEIAKDIRDAIEQVIASMNLFNQKIRQNVVKTAAVVAQSTKTADKAAILKPSTSALDNEAQALQELQKKLTSMLALVSRKTTEGNPNDVRKLFEDQIQPLITKAQTLLATQNPVKGPVADNNPNTSRQRR